MVKRLLALVLLLFTSALMASAGPSINVTVFDPGGKIVFKSATTVPGEFATANIAPGQYVVQFSSKKANAKKHYTLVVSSGTQKMSADAIAGDRFAGVGVAVTIMVGTSIPDVIKEHPGLNNPAAIRAMERDNKDAKITGRITLAR